MNKRQALSCKTHSSEGFQGMQPVA